MPVEGLDQSHETGGELFIRECSTIEEFDACVALQREAFGLPELELSPRRHLIVASKAGGWVLGAFAGERLVGFVLNQVGVRRRASGASDADVDEREIIGYSHMMAVAKEYQNRGVGVRLKWAQRERALVEGVRFIRWTWDPMQGRNAHFNLNRLGVIVRSYGVNYYGTDYSTATGEFGKAHGIDSDRLIAEWHLDSSRVERLAGGERSGTRGSAAATVEIPPDWTALLRRDPVRARDEMMRVRAEFQESFAAGLVCAGFERGDDSSRYLLFESAGE